MHAIPGFEVGDTLSSTSAALLLRARAEKDRRNVIVKVSRSEQPSARDTARLEHEYELSRSLDGVEEIVRYVGIVPLRSSVALVFEDFGGRPLDGVLASGPLAVDRAVAVALQIARALEALHTAGIVHRNVAPANVIYDPVGGSAKLGDLSLASRIPRTQQQPSAPSHLEGTLAYMAPEQTGRMNRAVDYRADFYSLGATLYHLLTGRPPFVGDDAMGLVHAHVAVQPTPVRSLRPDVPETLSALVAKLMAKSAEDRYQSARGLEADLVRCQSLLADGTAASFSLGSDDVSTTLSVSQKLYGRVSETRALLAAFERAAGGDSELLLVRGQPGIGKSVLVHEVHRPIVQRRGYFAQGKFDQLEMAFPLSGVKQAARDLLRQLLTESQKSLSDWAQRLRGALGEEARVLLDPLPELRHVIGEQPDVIELGPTEAQERFDRLLLAFLHEFASAEHPLVLFMDDLQWVDAASLRLLQRLVAHAESRHLLVIGSYRDNEVSPSHPLSLTVEKLREAGTRISAIELGPLTRDDVDALVADSINRDPVDVAPLAALIHQKTGGNPFLVTQLLRSIADDGLLRFSAREGSWVWDVEKIRALEVVEDVVHLMVGKILRYEESSQRALRLASFLGSTFDLDTLATVSALTPREAAKTLWEPVRDGLVVPLDGAFHYYQWARREHQDPPSAQEVRYRFAHDRIQEAAYSRVPQAERAEVHLRIARLLLERVPASGRQERIFDLANHFGAGVSLIEDAAERLRVAELHLAAGRRARSATAYREARDYLVRGIELLSADAWGSEYELAFALHRERVDCEFLSGDLQAAEAVFAEASKRAKTREHVGDIYQLMIRICHTADQHARGLTLGRECLKLFDVDLPTEPAEAQAVMTSENQRIDALLEGRDLASFLDHRLVEDPDMEICLGLLHETWTCSVMSGDFQQWILTALKIVRLSLENGHSKFSPCGYVAHAAVLALTGNHLRARDYGELAVALCHRFADPFIIGARSG
jgi:predicted ATPase